MKNWIKIHYIRYFYFSYWNNLHISTITLKELTHCVLNIDISNYTNSNILGNLNHISILYIYFFFVCVFGICPNKFNVWVQRFMFLVSACNMRIYIFIFRILRSDTFNPAIRVKYAPEGRRSQFLIPYLLLYARYCLCQSIYFESICSLIYTVAYFHITKYVFYYYYYLFPCV